jgi:hypothetical protein
LLSFPFCFCLFCFAFLTLRGAWLLLLVDILALLCV